MSPINAGFQAVHTTNQTSNISSSSHADNVIKVHIRLVFLRIGEIDTLNEKYQAHISIESRWSVSFDQLSSNLLSSADQQRLLEGKSISLGNYAESHWHPQLYIENSLGDLKEQINYSGKINSKDNQVYICEHRDVKGLFWEKLELHHFPSDVQDLSVSITSMLFNDKVVLIADPYRFSGVNLEAFFDQQKWSLYEHVNTEQRFLKDFLFRAHDEDDEDDRQMNGIASKQDRQRSVLTVTCHAARKSTYFFWNGYFLIFLITMTSFCTFAMPLQNLINRIQATFTLLLTSITFRWTVNKSLPTVSYLTSLDKYGILCISNLILHAMWHSMIIVVARESTPDYQALKDSWIVYLDHNAFYAFISLFVALHIIIIIWLYCVPFKHRRNMEENDEQYRISMLQIIKDKNRQSTKGQEKGPLSLIF